ncbi:MerR family transcriptional regulator [Robiginitomaculum antarcticum]|uniref:MerR family transcriptional regulator n=1 Tax=Robiginitomaculum antarcticum TaxID=437507 RepID=UPI000363C4FA|nr:MerR family transcriptional regulator [Robiginitomaculum antarcticum]
MTDKYSRAFRTISEASDELDLKPHVLRFWEAKFPDLKPVTRAGNRRFYRPEDIDFLRGLRILLHEERHKIKDVQKIIKLKGPDEIVKLGASAINRLPPKPIAERNLVPDRIKSTVGSEADNTLAAQDTNPEGKIVPVQRSFAAPVNDPRPAVRDVKIVQAAPPDTVSAPDSAVAAQIPAAAHIDDETREDLENALDRLSALRSRWKKFSE